MASSSGEEADLLPEEWPKGSCAGVLEELGNNRLKVYRCAPEAFLGRAGAWVGEGRDCVHLVGMLKQPVSGPELPGACEL